MIRKEHRTEGYITKFVLIKLHQEQLEAIAKSRGMTSIPPGMKQAMLGANNKPSSIN